MGEISSEYRKYLPNQNGKGETVKEITIMAGLKTSYTTGYGQSLHLPALMLLLTL